MMLTYGSTKTTYSMGDALLKKALAIQFMERSSRNHLLSLSCF